MAFGVLVQAEYADGYVLTEDEQDHSPYDSGKNTFNAILESRPVGPHGPMVRWSVLTAKRTYAVDWTAVSLLTNPRPIYYRTMERSWDQASGDDLGTRCTGHFFGYQYNGADGENIKEVIEIEV